MSMPSPRLAQPVLHLVSQQRWMAQELAGNGIGIPVMRCFGLDIPTHTEADAWWMPAQWAARAGLAGARMSLSAPGPRWLASLDRTVLGREVRACTVRDLGDLPNVAGWCKPAEAKIDGFTAGWRSKAGLFAAVEAVGMPQDAWIQWCPDRLDLVAEYRCHVMDGDVRTVSPYLVDGYTYYDMVDGGPGATRLGNTCEQNTAHLLAQSVVDDLGRAGQPAAYVLDVGFTLSGQCVVVEANPAWCSAWYGAAIDAAVTVISRSCRPDGPWRWRPDPYLLARARRATRLRMM